MAKTLSELFDRCKSKKFAGVMAGEVRSLAVSRDKQQMICHAAYDAPVSRAALDGLGREIAQAYGLTRFSIAPRYDMADGLTDAYIDQLRDDLCEAMPSANGLLADSDWTYADDGLRISMGETAKSYLSVALRQMQERIEAETGCRVPVEAVPFDADETARILTAQNEQRAEALKAAAHDLPAPAPSAEKPKRRPVQRQTGENGYVRQKAMQVKDEDLILGKLYAEEPVAIADALHEFDRVTIKGDVFFVDHKEIKSKKSGKEWVKLAFDITDHTNSIRVSKFMAKEQAGELVSAIKTGMHLIVQGKISFDSYEKESILEPTAIVKAKKKVRMDNAPEKRVELHLHTNMSALDGVSDTKDLINRCKLWGWPAMAITDHGCAQAFPLALHVVDGKEEDFPKILYGVEAYYVNDAAAVSVVRGPLDGSLDGAFIVFDLETTGLKPQTEEITEIAAVLVCEGEIKDSFQTYVNPHKPIPPEITELTGISDETVADAPELSEAIARFFDFMGERVLVAHNAGFDLSFLKAACRKLGIEREFTYIDTLEMSRILLPNLSRYKLNILAKELAVGPFEHHRASEDAAVLARIWIKLVDKLKVEQRARRISDINPLLAGLRAKEGGLKNLPRYHFIILVQNQIGLKNLYKLISYSFLDHFYKKPLMPRSELIKHREGLVFGSACEAGELFQAIVADKPFEELKRIAEFYDYLEIQPIGNNRFMLEKGLAADEEQLRDFNRTVLKLADALGKPCCATGDVHFLDPEDEAYRRILMAGQGFSDADKQAPLYLKTTEEMLEEFSYLGEEKAREVVITNTNYIADMIEELKPLRSGSYPPSIENCEEDLSNMCHEFAHKVYGNPLPPIVQARMDRELNCILGYGYAVMYMIAHKLVKKSNEAGYLVGSRGSVGSSFAAFLAGITEVNALCPHYICPKCKHSEFFENGEYTIGIDMPDKNCPDCGTKMKKDGFNIPFETFLGFEGDKVPDIDLNFSGEYQATAHKYVEELFGEGYVFKAGTIGTIADKTAIGFAKKYYEKQGINAPMAEIKRVSRGLENIKNTTGQHPGGVIVCPKTMDIHDFCPVQHPADKKDSGIITTHFDFHSIHDNLLKLDILGHDDPSTIRMLEDLTGVNVKEIPLDDPETMSIFSSTEAIGVTPDQIKSKVGTFGVPEFGTSFTRQMLLDTLPTTFYELVIIAGLSHGTDVWLNNAQDLVKKGIASLSEVIGLRDDIMTYLLLHGLEPKMAFNIMEFVRKGRAAKEGMPPEYEQAMIEHDVPSWYIESCKKIKYMFPKAHAAAYVMMSFRVAYFKVHYPVEFYIAYYTVRADLFDVALMAKGDDALVNEMHKIEHAGNLSATEKSLYTIMEVVHEMYQRGFEFLPVDLYKSDSKKFRKIDGKILPPLNAFGGVGTAAAESIVAAREDGEFISREDLKNRAGINKSVMETLADNGVLDGLPETSQISLFEM